MADGSLVHVCLATPACMNTMQAGFVTEIHCRLWRLHVCKLPLLHAPSQSKPVAETCSSNGLHPTSPTTMPNGHATEQGVPLATQSSGITAAAGKVAVGSARLNSSPIL